MSQGHRVYVRKKYIDIYRELRAQKSSSPRIFKDNKGLFVLATTIGFKSGEQKSFQNKEQLMWSDALDDYQQTVIKAIAIKSTNENNLNILNNPEEMYSIAENYANKGMDILIEEVFKDYIKENEDNTLTIAYNEKSQLQRQLAHFVDSLQKENNPFN
ncbi:hypothetical protein [Marinococcus halophilus]|uniref:hypothetical protein n=1 Tax=Marinococcus halophilus TaxID=1371 RepID=UPI0009A80E25|nr:hypothetical protein [Marinococcus halophilus]